MCSNQSVQKNCAAKHARPPIPLTFPGQSSIKHSVSRTIQMTAAMHRRGREKELQPCMDVIVINLARVRVG